MRCQHVLIAVAVWLRCGVAGGETIRQPLVAPRDAVEQRLLEDARDGRLQQQALLDAALIASGADPAKYASRFATVAQQLRREVAPLSSLRDRAAAVLAALHHQFLVGSFAPHCGNVAESLEGRRFNCVTAAILYVCLAETIELPVTVLHAPGHVRVRIDGAAPFEIEPTVAAWFRQADPRLLAWSQPPRELSPAALVAKLYYNQGVTALEENRFATATAAFDRSLLLDPADQAARHNLLASLNNGALERCARRDFVAAASLLQEAATVDPQYPPLATNDLHLLGQWTVALCEAGDFAQAIATVEQAIARHPQSELSRSGLPAVYRLWAEALQRQGEFNAALARVEAGLAVAPEHVELQRLQTRLKYPPRASRN